jgi:glycosyltransferase involved in cell wall biosynthesis
VVTADPPAPRARVAYVVRSWPRLSQTFVLDEVLALERLGLELELFALARSDEPLAQPEVALVRAPVHHLAAPVRHLAAHVRLAAAKPRCYLRAALCTVRARDWERGYHAASRWRCFALAVRLATALRRRPPAHLHAHFAHDPAAVAFLAHLLTGIPWSFTAHARDLYQVQPAVLGQRVAAARFAVSCSAAGAAYLRGLLPERLAARVHLVHHGVDVATFAPPPKRPERSPGDPSSPLLVSAGRLVEKKGFGDLLEACGRVKQAGVRFRLALYGDGPLAGELAAAVDRLGLAGEVTLAGPCTRAELAAAMRRADAFALTPFVTADGDRDGIPNVLLEAMASGLPLVTTSSGGIPEAVRHGSEGLVAAPRDVDAIAAHLATLLADPAARARLGAAARRAAVLRFDRRGAVERLAGLLAAASTTTDGRVPLAAVQR